MVGTYSALGTEFIATYGRRLEIGDRLSVDANGNQAEVVGFDGLTYSGPPWYKFRVVRQLGEVGVK